MKLSIIICTWNNSKRLGITLNSLQLCDHPDELDWEVIVVDNNCTDNTRNVINEYSTVLPIRYIYEPMTGLSHARNAGLRAARGRWIIFTDDDVRPCVKWISSYLWAFDRWPGGYFFGGPVESEFEKSPEDLELLKESPWSVKGLNWGESILVGDQVAGFLAANWAASRKSLCKIGGFDTSLGLVGSGIVNVGEETYIMSELERGGMQKVYLPEAKLRHYVPEDKLDKNHVLSRKRAEGRYNELVAGRRYGVLIGACKSLILMMFKLWYSRICGENTSKIEIEINKRMGQIQAIVDRRSVQVVGVRRGI